MNRKKWAYAPPAKPVTCDQFSCEHPLSHPQAGGTAFGVFPEIVVANAITFPRGEIFLRYGMHYGPNNGFGFRHIWVEHFHQEADHDKAMERTIAFVAKILVPRTPIFYETGARAAVFRGTAGQVIVGLRDGMNGPNYSVITAFVPRNAKGSRIGALA